MVRKTNKTSPAKILFLGVTFLILPALATAQTSSSAAVLQDKINQRNADIQALEKEIQGYVTQLNTLGGQEQSLSSTIKTLDLTQKKLKADITVTEDKIDSTNLKIQQLTTKIGATDDTITDDTRYVMQSFK